MARKCLIIGNWKMYKTGKEAKDFFATFLPLLKKEAPSVACAVPFTAIQSAENPTVLIGAQNMHDAEEGAFTGEISAKMLKDAGAEFVILGHSERRTLFHESNEFIQRKVERAVKAGIRVVLCVGETLQEREKGLTEKVLTTQLKECLHGISSLDLIDIAYEPMWAIGTGKTATPEIAQAAHQHCRSVIGSESTRILYGGSVKLDSIRSLIAQKDIDGALVGGASLDPAGFAELVNHIIGIKS